MQCNVQSCQSAGLAREHQAVIAMARRQDHVEVDPLPDDREHQEFLGASLGLFVAVRCLVLLCATRSVRHAHNPATTSAQEQVARQMLSYSSQSANMAEGICRCGQSAVCPSLRNM